MQIQSLTHTATAYNAYAFSPPQTYKPTASSPSAYGQDRLNFEQPTYDPALPPRGNIWDRSDVRVGLIMAGSATVGAGVGYYVAQSAGLSIGLNMAMGAALGAALPIAAVYIGMSMWDGN